MICKYLFLFDGQEFDDIFMFDFLKDFEFSHLDLLGPHVRKLVKRLDSHRLPIVFVHALQKSAYKIDLN